MKKNHILIIAQSKFLQPLTLLILLITRCGVSYCEAPQTTYEQAYRAYVTGNYTTAIEKYKTLHEHYPQHSAITYNLGLSYRSAGLFENATHMFTHAFKLNPTNNHIRNKLLQEKLRAQQWSDAQKLGLIRYWWQDESLHNKKILITHDGGFGDVFMFLRYAYELHKHGAHITLQIPQCLHKLLSNCPYIDKLINCTQKLPETDYTFRISTPELTLTLAPILDKPYTHIPYLYAPQKRIEYWKSVVKQHDKNKRKIGICWQSSYIYNPITKEKMPGPRGIPLDAFKPLLQRTDSLFYSLQKGKATKQLARISHDNVIHFDDSFDTDHGSFVDTAALMHSLDLVITTDTSIAHLAGALGIPVWTLLPKSSDFRWFYTSSTTPWYPTMRLFRQHNLNDWQSVIANINQSLDECSQ